MKGVGIFIHSKFFFEVFEHFPSEFLIFLSKFLMELQQQLTAAHVTPSGKDSRLGLIFEESCFHANALGNAEHKKSYPKNAVFMRGVVSKIVFTMDTKKQHRTPLLYTGFQLITFKGDWSSYFPEPCAEWSQSDTCCNCFPKTTEMCCPQKWRDSLGVIVVLRFNYLSTELQVSMLRRQRTNKAIIPRSPPFSL